MTILRIKINLTLKSVKKKKTPCIKYILFQKGEGDSILTRRKIIPYIYIYTYIRVGYPLTLSVNKNLYLSLALLRFVVY